MGLGWINKNQKEILNLIVDMPIEEIKKAINLYNGGGLSKLELVEDYDVREIENFLKYYNGKREEFLADMVREEEAKVKEKLDEAEQAVFQKEMDAWVQSVNREKKKLTKEYRRPVIGVTDYKENDNKLLPSPEEIKKFVDETREALSIKSKNVENIKELGKYYEDTSKPIEKNIAFHKSFAIPPEIQYFKYGDPKKINEIKDPRLRAIFQNAYEWMLKNNVKVKRITDQDIINYKYNVVINSINKELIVKKNEIVSKINDMVKDGKDLDDATRELFRKL